MTAGFASSLESRLAEAEPFGSYESITGLVAASYIQLLEFLLEGSAAARALHIAVADLDHGARWTHLRDPALRRTIEDGVCAAVEGLPAIPPALLEEVLTAAAATAPTDRPLMRAGARYVPLTVPAGAPQLSLWADGEPGTPSGRRFLGEVLKRLPGFSVAVPTPEQVDALETAVRLAYRMVPVLAASVLPHASIVLIGSFPENAFNALTTPGLPGVLVVSPTAFTGSADLAETLMHESTHLKFLDIEYAHPLFVIGYRRDASTGITPVWRRNTGDTWSVDRVLTAAHVYVMLTILLQAAGEPQFHDLAVKDRAARLTQCTERAAWLLDEAGNHRDVLTESGQEFLSWLEGIIRHAS